MLLQQRRPQRACKTKAPKPASLVCRPVTIPTDRDKPHAGYGACSKCNCRGYEGSTYACANGGCGHAYGDHW